jgi:hypothetical protein
MIKPSVTKIIEVMRNKGFRIYETDTIEWNLNIIGIRNSNLDSKKFDYTLIVFHKFLNEWYINYYPITTDPSEYYLRRPINSSGTAILVEGQYLGAYQIGLHNNNYTALCQRLGNVKVYRDDNRNNELDINVERIWEGMYGINIHKGPKNGDWNSRNRWYSAGCQVFADTRHFNEFMLKCRNGAAAFGNKFTYTLLNERDFN